MRRQRVALMTIAALCALASGSGRAGTVDGVYKGTMDLNTGVANDPRCAKTWTSTLEVKDNHMLSLTTDIKPVSLYAIDVGVDGRFNGRASTPGDNEWRTFAGTIAGNTVTGQFYNRFCHYFLNFQKAQ